MRRLKVVNYLKSEELESKMNSEKKVAQFKAWQCIYLVQTNYGISAEEVSETIRISKSQVYRYVQKYNTYGPEGIIFKPRGGRQWSYLSLSEEKNLLRKISKKAVTGLILTAEDIRKEVEKKIGRTVSDDYLWDLFKRHSWKKKSPRPAHPKSKTKRIKEERETFKKNLKKMWRPSN